VRSDVVVTGALRDGRVVGVGRIDAKLDAARRARGVARLVLPAADRAALPQRVRGLELVAVRTPEELVEAALEARPVTSADVEGRLRELERAFRAAWREGAWERLRADLEPLLAELPATRTDLQVLAHAMLGAALRHLGEPHRSLTVVQRGERARDDDSDGVPDRERSLLARQKAMTLRQLGAFDEADVAARDAVTSARRGRLRGELIPSLGTAGLLARSRGRSARAVALLEEALALSERHAPASASRAAAYLVEALGARGHLDEARRAYERGLATLAHERDGARAGRERWLRVALASVLVRRAASAGRSADETAWLAEACALLDVPFVRESVVHEPLPGLLVRRWLGLALARSGHGRGLALLGDSPTAFGRTLRGHPLALAQQNVLYELWVRIERREVDADARARGRLALVGMRSFDAARPLVAGARAELEREAPRARPLVALLEACDRLG
jgi:tetratricopeptide (TPR) repeat protein